MANSHWRLPTGFLGRTVLDSGRNAERATPWVGDARFMALAPDHNFVATSCGSGGSRPIRPISTVGRLKSAGYLRTQTRALTRLRRRVRT